MASVSKVFATVNQATKESIAQLRHVLIIVLTMVTAILGLNAYVNLVGKALTVV